MPWDYNTARDRIRKKIEDAPDVNVRSFKDDYYPFFLDRQKTLLEQEVVSSNKPLFDLQSDNAILVNTVQIYINITNYEDYRLEDGLESEASHKKALQFLHFHYSTCDRVVENTNAQRVDFHSARMHAVILEDLATGITGASVMEAIHLAKHIEALAEVANKSLAAGSLKAEFRVGIDVGRCVAINSGNGKDSEPLFLGGAANYAAKLAADDQAGIYLSDNARALLNMPQVFGLLNEKTNSLTDFEFQMLAEGRPFASRSGEFTTTNERAETLLASWNTDIQNKVVDAPTVPSFQFHHKAPPLSDLDYDTIFPSNSIRMPVSSFYADLDGYTAYVDDAMSNGNVQEAVTVIDVMRSEMQSVLEEDFGGRKVRFIGDCIHGILAEGNSSIVSLSATMRESALCAGALRSSFELCRSEFSNVNLGLAIGVELGETPVSRIGIRGERGVRVASSSSTIESELLQQGCDGNQTKFGTTAISNLPVDLGVLFNTNGTADDLSYDDVVLNNTGLLANETDVQTPEHRSHFEAC